MPMWGEERVYVGGRWGAVSMWGEGCVCIYVEGGEMSPSQFWPQTSLQPLYKGVLAVGWASHLVGTG